MKLQLADRDVRERAYRLWEARGRPEGSPDKDWFEAERELRVELDTVSTAPLEALAQEAAAQLQDPPERELETIPQPRGRKRGRTSAHVANERG